MRTGRLAGLVAVVTGASRGIGAAVATAYGAEGAAVAIACAPQQQNVEQAEKLVAELRADGTPAVAVAADLAEVRAIDRLVDRVRAELGAIDIIVNNAAASPRSDLRQMSVAEWDYVQKVNVRAPWLLARAAHGDLRNSKNASVINVTSVMVETGGQPGALHYVTSKAALLGFTRALAREFGGDGIRVNAVMPGAIRTEDETERAPDAEAVLAKMIEVQALERRGFADDLTGTFVFLASKDSSFITGQVINVDGGWVHY